MKLQKLKIWLEQLKKPININNNSYDETGSGGGTSGSGGTPGSGPPPGYPDSVEDMTRRLNILRGNCPCSPSLSLSQRDVLSEVLQNRFNRIRYGSTEPTQEKNFLNRGLSEKQKEISQILKGIIKSTKSDAGFILPDTPPATPKIDDFPLPPYFSSPPVGPSDTNFIMPQIPKPQIPSLIDKYVRPITKTIDDKKIQ